MPGTVSRTITVRPRVQFDRFSLYWKESMATKTQILPDVVLEKLPSENVHDLIDYLLSTHLQYPTLEDLSKCRLEGFQGPWVRVLQSGKLVYSSNGKEEASGMPLAELNLDEPLVVVRVEACL